MENLPVALRTRNSVGRKSEGGRKSNAAEGGRKSNAAEKENAEDHAPNMVLRFSAGKAEQEEEGQEAGMSSSGASASTGAKRAVPAEEEVLPLSYIHTHTPLVPRPPSVSLSRGRRC